MTGLLLLLIFIGGLALNIPIAFALAISTVGVLFIQNIIPVDLVVQTYFTSADSFPLLAVPFFILAGDIMIYGGISKRLVNFSTKMVGNVSGALGIVTVFACMIFAAISGSAIATVAAIGGIMIPAMVKEGYEVGFAASLASTSGSLGPVIPPSISFILYGIISGVSITDMFIAGIIPGIVIGLCLMIFVYIVSKKYKFGTIQSKVTMKEKWEAFNEAKWSLLIPIIILGGIYGGFFTPTEAAVITCDYGLIIGIFVYKEINAKQLWQIFRKSAITVGSICILLGAATALGKILTIENIPQLIAQTITDISTNPIVVLIIINVFLLIVGMFIDVTPALILLTPLLLPVAKTVGVSPVHFGIVMVFNLVIGMSTPPIGVNMFVASKISNIGVEKMFKWLYPCIGVLIIALATITFIPQLSTFLPSLR